MPKKKPTEPKPKRPNVSYPSAPTDPTERRAYFRYRNALIANVDPDEYMRAIEVQDERVAKHGDHDQHALRKQDR